MFSRLAFQSMHLKLSSFPITQLMNRNNAIPHIRESLSCTEGLSGCADGLCTIHDSLLCDLSSWRLGLALKGRFWLKKQNLFTENCLRQRNPKDPLLSLISLTTVDLSLSVICFEFPVRDLSGKFKLSFFSTTKTKTTGSS